MTHGSEIRDSVFQMYVKNHTYLEIADHYNLSRNTVASIIFSFKHGTSHKKTTTPGAKRRVVREPFFLKPEKLPPRPIPPIPDRTPFSHCQYIFGEAINRHFCTNQATHRAWCEGHYRLTHVISSRESN